MYSVSFQMVRPIVVPDIPLSWTQTRLRQIQIQSGTVFWKFFETDQPRGVSPVLFLQYDKVSVGVVIGKVLNY